LEKAIFEHNISQGEMLCMFRIQGVVGYLITDLPGIIAKSAGERVLYID